MITRRPLATLILLLAAALLGSCAAAGSASPRANMSYEQFEQLQSLVNRQGEHFESYRGINAADRCPDLCEHLGEICSLRDKICRIARAHPHHDLAQASCRSARQVCEDATASLPEECTCQPPASHSPSELQSPTWPAP